MLKLRFTFFVISMLLLCNLYAQQNIYFINKAKNKIVEVKLGQQLSLKYNGYLGQPEFVKQTVSEINDSFVVLGINPDILGKTFEKAVSKNPKYIFKKVLLKDIVSFRKISAGRQLLKSGLLLSSLFGSSYLLADLYSNSSLTHLETFWISFGIAVVSNGIINLAFPENPKYDIGNCWIITTGYSKPNL
jgi:hypothetical protein